MFGIVNLRKDNILEADKKYSFYFQGNTYEITYSGHLYNTKELKELLSRKQMDLETNKDEEILIKLYIVLGKEMIEHLNGVYSFVIWNEKEKSLFAVRDRFGLEPFYFTNINGKFIFASSIKEILKSQEVTAKLDSTGISELIGIGPAHSPGKTPFKDINELEPAHFISMNQDIFYKKEYWHLKAKYHNDDFETTCEKVRDLMTDAINLQVNSTDNVCSSLSGGLDSSIVTLIANDIYQEKGKKLNTFSVDYVDQEKNFVKNDFQPNLDMEYINLMVEKLGTNHEKIVIDTPELYDRLNKAMIARDFPGMADVDSSYLLFFEKIAKTGNNVILAGECSDEIFGGYPWYFREDTLSSNTFPWSLAINERQNILNEDIGKKIDLKEYIQNEYNKSLSKVEFLETDSAETKLHRKLIYLTLNWFMITLLDRTDRMAKMAGVEVRVPFCDYRVMEYAWNIPWEMKAYKGREKGLLRKAFEGYLPEEVVHRKKSPYPKTHNPNYLQRVKQKLTDILNSKDNKITQLLNEKYLREIIETDGKAFARPWFGQLMTGPQLMAYFIQLELWLQEYKPEINI